MGKTSQRGYDGTSDIGKFSANESFLNSPGDEDCDADGEIDNEEIDLSSGSVSWILRQIYLFLSRPAHVYANVTYPKIGVPA